MSAPTETTEKPIEPEGAKKKKPELDEETKAKYAAIAAQKKAEAQEKKKQAAAAAKAKGKPQSQAIKKDTAQLLGIEAKKDENFSEWYSQVITRAELIDYYDISGCYILRPNSYSLWESIQSYLDSAFKTLSVTNCYFPIFVSPQALKREEDELHGFEAEVAWVTKSGKTDLAIPVAVRPTSETVMYPAFKNWISSHRDLPLKVNQWCNIVRWEFKHPVPFIRTREFLWQEGHTAHVSLEEAEKEVYVILDFYAKAYEEMLAVPVVKGKKSEKEKFAGALFTTTIEAFVPANGRSVQAATSHCLGQTFAKMFEVEFLDENGNKAYVWQNSWGFTTRSIGVMVMVHGDDKGLVLPPKIATKQVVIIPIAMKETNVEELNKAAHVLCGHLKAENVRSHVDDGIHNPGWKFNHWEKLGVPIRVELGPRDLAAHTVVVVRRDTGVKVTVSWDDLTKTVVDLLNNIQKDMFSRAKEIRDKHVIDVTEWKDFVPTLGKKCICRVPWCDTTECEDSIKERSAKESVEIATSNVSEDDLASGLTGAAKSLCKPFDQPKLAEDAKCFACGKKAVVTCLFGRSY